MLKEHSCKMLFADRILILKGLGEGMKNRVLFWPLMSNLQLKITTNLIEIIFIFLSLPASLSFYKQKLALVCAFLNPAGLLKTLLR